MRVIMQEPMKRPHIESPRGEFRVRIFGASLFAFGVWACHVARSIGLRVSFSVCVCVCVCGLCFSITIFFD